MVHTYSTSLQSFATASILTVSSITGFALASPLDFNVPGDYATIQDAWDAVPSSGNHVIHISPGIYNENLDLSGKAATLMGNTSNPASVVLDGGSSGATVSISDSPGITGPLIQGLTITGGSGYVPSGSFFSYGGGIYIESDGGVILQNCIVRENDAVYGGGVYAGTGSSVQLHDTTVTANTALIGGGMNLGGYSALSTSLFLNNESTTGGHLALRSPNDPATIINCMFIDGKAYNDMPETEPAGGAIAILNQPNVSVRSSLFQGNTSQYLGGAISCRGLDYSEEIRCSFGSDECIPVSLEILDCTFKQCDASYGGAIFWVNTGSMEIFESSFENCTSGQFGGAIQAMQGELTLTSSDYSDCSANHVTFFGYPARGGAIDLDSVDVDIVDVTFNACRSLSSGSGNIDDTGEGGALSCVRSNVRINTSTFYDNFSEGPGGAISSYESRIDVSDSIFSGNTGDGAVSIQRHSDHISNDASFKNCSFELSGLFAPLGDARGTIHLKGLSPLGEFPRPAIFEQCHFRDNWSALGGAAIRAEVSFVTIKESSFEGNDITEGTGSGGAIDMSLSIVNVQDSQFDENLSADQAGAVNVAYSEFLSESNIYDSNQAVMQGGSISCTRCILEINHDTYLGSGDQPDAMEGGAIYIGADSLFVYVRSSNFEGLKATQSGGAIKSLGELAFTEFIVQECSIRGNEASDGGAIHASGLFLLTNSRICGNTPEQLSGDYEDGGDNVIQDTCCQSDFNGDGLVDGGDLTNLLAAWGTDGSTIPGTDINGDGLVNGEDLTMLLGDWGSCG